MSEAAAVPAGVMNTVGMPVDGGVVDVEEIMVSIRKNIEARNKSRVCREDALLPQGSDFLQPGNATQSTADHLALLSRLAQIDLEGEPIVSHRSFLRFPIRWAKAFTRFWVRKYTDDLLTRQNCFNAEVLAVLSDLNRQLEEQKAENKRLREQIETLLRR